MMPELLFYGGLIVCGAAVLCAIVTAVILRVSKLRLNKKLDAEYGKRRQ